MRVSLSSPTQRWLPHPVPRILEELGFRQVASGLYLGKSLRPLLHELNLCGVVPHYIPVPPGQWAVSFPENIKIRFRYEKPAQDSREEVLRAFRDVHKNGVILKPRSFLVLDPRMTRVVLASQGFKRDGVFYVQRHQPWLRATVDDGPYGSQQITLHDRQQELFDEQAEKGA